MLSRFAPESKDTGTGQNSRTMTLPIVLLGKKYNDSISLIGQSRKIPVFSRIAEKMTTLMIGQKQQDTFKRYDDFIKSIANGRRLAESCGQDTVDTTQRARSKLLS